MIPSLLIVPYGIETHIRHPSRLGRASLLIVPYGIETTERGSRLYGIFSFNRTLWN